MKTSIKDLRILASACAALGLTDITTGSHSVRVFTRDVRGDFSVKLPGWNYPVVVDATTGEVHYDNYNQAWGKDKELHKLLQEYALETSENQLEEFKLQGWNIERQMQDNGDIQIVATSN